VSSLPLRSLEAFVVVARALSLTRAAATLNITVPAASRRIKILESLLGVRLFDRLPRGLALTAAGERYVAELGPAWDAMRAATEAARAPARRNGFRVSVIPTFAANWLVPRLAKCGSALGNLEIELETSPDIVDLAERRDLDCAIRLGRGPWPGTVGHKVLPVEAYPVASPGFIAGGRLQSPDALAAHTLIGSNHQPDFWPEWFRLAAPGGDVARYRYKSFDNLQLVYEAAAANLGVAIGLDPLVRPYLQSGRLARLWPQRVVLSRSFHLVRRAERSRNSRFARFDRWLSGEATSAAEC
jgi:LysR family glycine cleavage system transcriptional activator